MFFRVVDQCQRDLLSGGGRTRGGVATEETYRQTAQRVLDALQRILS
jgi:hypothetical protein